MGDDRRRRGYIAGMSDVPPTASSGATARPAGGHAAPPGSGRRGRRFSTGQLLGALLFVLTLVFVFENTRSVKVRLIIPEVSAPLALPIVIAAVLGAGVAWLLRYRRRRHRTR